MTIPPLESSPESGLNLARWSAPAPLDDHAFESIGQTVRHAAGALDGLKDILERLHGSVAQATEQRRNDIEIGQLFMRAQEFVDGAVAEGHAIAQRIIGDAEFEASRIVAAAKDEAHRLIEEGRQTTALPTEGVRALQATIAEFARMNGALVQELSGLTDALATRRDMRPVAPSNTLSQALSQTEALSRTEAGSLPAVAPVQPRPVETGTRQGEEESSQPQASPPAGYWSTLRPSREVSGPRVGRHSAPGTRWQTR